MLTAVRRLLELSSCSFERAFYGLRETRLLAWVRPADISFTTGADFPYHFTVEGLAQLASNLITERGDPEGMARILGDDYGLSTVAAPHGLLHKIAHNGNHRTVAIKAAGNRDGSCLPASAPARGTADQTTRRATRDRC
jgi:hypothetical protein